MKLVYLVHYDTNFGRQLLCSDLDDTATIEIFFACVSLTKRFDRIGVFEYMEVRRQ